MQPYPTASPPPRMPVAMQPMQPMQPPPVPNQPPALPPGTILFNRYLIQGYIGGGGFGHIYKALDNALGYRRAIKEAFYQDPQTRHQFHLEAEFLLNARHPNLVRGYAVFEQMGRLYLVMDYVDGHTLEEIAIDHIRRTGRPLPEAHILDWMIPICDAAHALHSCPVPVIHRDVKPANVKVNRQGIPILIDLGLAKLFARGTQTLGAALAFTPGYAPPEQYQAAGTTDARTDVYGLGASLFYLLTGYQPTEAPARLGALTAPPLSHLNPAISDATQAAVLRAMELDPARRQQSALELEHELRAARAALGPLDFMHGHLVSRPTAAPMVCARCGSANPAVARYCMRCGVPLTAGQAPLRHVSGTHPLDAVALLTATPDAAAAPPLAGSGHMAPHDDASQGSQGPQVPNSGARPPVAGEPAQPAGPHAVGADDGPCLGSDGQARAIGSTAPAAVDVSDPFAGHVANANPSDLPVAQGPALTSLPPTPSAAFPARAGAEPAGSAAPTSEVSLAGVTPPATTDLPIDQPAIAMPPLRRGPVPAAVPLRASSSPGKTAARSASTPPILADSQLWHPGAWQPRLRISPQAHAPQPALAPQAQATGQAMVLRHTARAAAGAGALWLRALPSMQRWHAETLSAAPPLDEMEVRSGIAALLAVVLAVGALAGVRFQPALALALPAVALAHWCLHAREVRPTQEARWLATVALVISYTWLALSLVGLIVTHWPSHR